MKYIVINYVNEKPYICADLTDEQLANKLKNYYDNLNTGKSHHAEVCYVMDDENVKKMFESIEEDNTRTPKQKFNYYIKWLDNTDFGSDLLNELAREIGTTMSALYVHGCEYWDPEIGTEVGFEVDQQNPNTHEVTLFAINKCIKNDIELLKEYGITTKKPTKKLPHRFSDIDWNVFINEKLF